jgi:hypothetical protein
MDVKSLGSAVTYWAKTDFGKIFLNLLMYQSPRPRNLMRDLPPWMDSSLSGVSTCRVDNRHGRQNDEIFVVDRYYHKQHK